MQHWWKVLSNGQKDGHITYQDLTDILPEGIPALDIEAAIEIVEALNIQFASDIEKLPVHQNVVEMVEYRKRLRNPEYIADDVLEGEDINELAGTEV